RRDWRGRRAWGDRGGTWERPQGRRALPAHVPGAVGPRSSGPTSGRSRLVFELHCEPVVVAGDLDPAGIHVQHRLIRASVAELQLVAPRTQRDRHQLVAQTDAEHGDLAEQLPTGVDSVLRSGGVAGAVGEKDAVEVAGE